MPDTQQLVIFLSPHFDDIALSCGGMAARLARTGARCIAVTVCAAPAAPGEPLSPFMAEMHSNWERASGTTVDAINEVRREEERQALKLLGLEHTWLDVPDAPYRRNKAGEHLYTSDEKLFGRVAPEERQSLVPRIASEIARIARDTGAKGHIRVFAPLGVGHHVDHQLVFWAARRLPSRYGVLFYEDFPYAIREGGLRTRLEEIGLPAQPRVAPITELIGIKIASINKYKSQLEVLFGSAEAMPRAVRQYGQQVAGAGTDQYAERFWHLPSVYTVRET